MNAILRGIKNVEYTKKDTKELKKGIELHCERAPFPTEPFTKGSCVVFTEYLGITEQSKMLVDAILSFPIGSEIDLIYVSNGRYSNLVDVRLIK